MAATAGWASVHVIYHPVVQTWSIEALHGSGDLNTVKAVEYTLDCGTSEAPCSRRAEQGKEFSLLEPRTLL